MSWRTGTATDYVDLLNKLRDHAIGTHVATAVVASGGTGYTVGDILTIAGGTAYQACKVLVLTAPAGVIGTVKVLLGGGSYSANPASPNSPTGGTGTTASLTLTFATNGWTVNRDVVYGTTEKELQLQGIGTGSDAIYVGIRTYRDTNVTAFNWELAGMTGFNTSTTWDLQPGISPGRNDSVTAPSTVGGSYVPLDNNSMTYWMSATGRRLIVVAKVGTAYMTCYLGFYNSFSTTGEQPYPLVVAGMTSQKDTRFNSSRVGISFFPNATGKQIASGPAVLCPGPVQVRWADGSWQSFTNQYEAFANQASSNPLTTPRLIYPMSYDRIANQAPEDSVFNGTWDWNFIIPNSGINPALELHPTPGSQVPLWPVGMSMGSPSFQILGEFDTAFWLSIAGSGLVSEDAVVIAGDNYRIFQNGPRTDSFQYMAIKES